MQGLRELQKAQKVFLYLLCLTIAIILPALDLISNINSVADFQKMGQKGYCTTHLSFGDKGDCQGWLVGEENKGLSYMFLMMNAARIAVGRGAAAIASAAYYASLQYARDRVQGRPVGMSKEDAKKSTIIDHADVRRMLMTMKSYTDAMRYLMYDNQLMMDLEYFAEDEETKAFGEERCGLLTPVTKAWNLLYQ